MSKPQKIDVLVLHHTDPDGYCAGAIVRYHEMMAREIICETYGMNYGYKVPWSKINRAKKIYMVDFCLPVNDMIKIQKAVGYGEFIWIDHHKTSIEDVEKNGIQIAGLREIGKAGCELTWIYFNYDKPMPKAIKTIGRYDVWDVEYNNPQEGILKENIFPFIQGIKYYEADADDDHFWYRLFESEEYYDKVLSEGRILYDYQSKMYARYCKSHSFEFEWEGLRFLAVNSLNCNSQMFDSMFDHHKHDAVLAYGYTNRNWSVSMYTNKDGVDVGALAHKYGGGGHVQACGFSCNELPFEHLLEWKPTA